MSPQPPGRDRGRHSPLAHGTCCRSDVGARDRHCQCGKPALDAKRVSPGRARGTHGSRCRTRKNRRSRANPSLNLESVFPNYFATLEVRISRGRAFAELDREGTPPVAIINEDVAARAWPGDDPIGRRRADAHGHLPGCRVSSSPPCRASRSACCAEARLTDTECRRVRIVEGQRYRGSCDSALEGNVCSAGLRLTWWL